METCEAHDDMVIVYEWRGRSATCPVCALVDAIASVQKSAGNLPEAEDITDSDLRGIVDEIESLSL